MPSLAIEKKEEEKMMKKKVGLDTPEIDSVTPKKKSKREPKLMDTKGGGGGKEEEVDVKKKEKKKRKTLDVEVENEFGEEKSETSSELGEPVNLKKKRKKEEKLEVEEVEEEGGKSEDPNAVSRFRISEPLREKLKEKGIESLFPIQAMTFDMILDGSDLVGRARTGQV